MVVGTFFLLCNTCCVCFCLLTVIASSLLIINSQNAYLHVGGSAAVWRTSTLCVYVYWWYGCALMCFLLDAVLLMWVFLGLPQWMEVRVAGVGGEDVLTRDGVELVRCLDHADDASHERRNAFGRMNAVLSTSTFGLFVLYGLLRMRQMAKIYEMDAMRGPDDVNREEQAYFNRTKLRREVYVLKRRKEDKLRELASLRRTDADAKDIFKKEKQFDDADRKLVSALGRQHASKGSTRILTASLFSLGPSPSASPRPSVPAAAPAAGRPLFGRGRAVTVPTKGTPRKGILSKRGPGGPAQRPQVQLASPPLEDLLKSDRARNGGGGEDDKDSTA